MSDMLHFPGVRPILFHDIDGVLFGSYDGHFQLRPAVNTWLAWVHEHFEVIWLTAWEEAKVKSLLDVTNNGRHKVCYANWSAYVSKELWLKQAAGMLKDREWFWIDDNIPEVLEIPPARCIRVSPEGMDTLLHLERRLAGLLDRMGSK